MKLLMNPGFVRTSLTSGASCLIKSQFPSLIRPAFGLAAFLYLLISGDAVAASFSNASPLQITRSGQTATLLSNGKLLVAGGQTNGGFTSSTAELYDPAVGTWTMTNSMKADRVHHTATMLGNGKILVVGGYNSS